MRAAGSLAQPGHRLRPFLPPCHSSSSTGKLRGKLGYPTRKTRKRGLGGFRLTGTIVVFPGAIQLPRLGRLRLKERDYLPIKRRKVLSATVTEQAGHWYVSVLVEQEQTVPDEPRAGRGGGPGRQDPGNTLGWHESSQPAPLETRLKKLKRLQRAVSRKRRAARTAARRSRRLAQTASPRRQSAGQHVASAHQPTGENQVSRGD